MKKYHKGFTLLELLAVIIILAALSTIAITIFTNKSHEAKQLAHNENIRTLQRQAQAYLMSLKTMPQEGIDISAELLAAGFIKEIPKNPMGIGDYKVIMNSDKTASVVVPANAPALTAGMAPVKWGGANWVPADKNNTNSGGTGDTRKYGWYSDFSLGGWGSKRFFLRGGQFSNSTGAFAFAFDCINGYPYYHSGFRPVVVLSKN